MSNNRKRTKGRPKTNYVAIHIIKAEEDAYAHTKVKEKVLLKQFGVRIKELWVKCTIGTVPTRRVWKKGEIIKTKTFTKVFNRRP